MSKMSRVLLACITAMCLMAFVATSSTPATAKSLASSMTSLKLHGASCGCCETKCCYNPCINYKSKHKRRSVCCGCGCNPLEKITLVVADPATCDCAVEVPICIPACCEGDPCVTSRCGALGRRIVWYEWSCGFKARVVFNRHNDITVTSFGA